MEHRLLSDLHRSFDQNPNTLSSKSTTTTLSLITNPHTSESTLDFIVHNLSAHLQNPDSLSLLAILSRRSDHLRSRISAAVHNHLAHVPNQSLPLVLPLIDAFGDESLFLTLGFSSSEKNRRWLLRNVNLFRVKPSVLVTVMLGFSKDPFPYVREAALDCLVSLLRSNVVVEDLSLVECCYFRCVEMLFDVENGVRCSAVRAVSEWGHLLVESSADVMRRELSDALFVQLCLMVKDMDMETRAAAFDSLGKIQTVSEDLLLQSLSKKALPALKDKYYRGQYTPKLDKIPATAAAFAFVRGLEDEFHEVRRSACRALQMLMVLSAEFAAVAVHASMELLNDDTIVVRLQALETLFHIAMQGHLKVEESHLHLFVGTLFDSDVLVRSTARKVLQSTKFPTMVIFKSWIDGLVKNLELYPEDEADIFFVLYKFGRAHGKLVSRIIHDVAQEIEPSFDGNLNLHKRRTTALFVLAISAPVSLEKQICSIQPQIFSYAVTMLSQLSHAVRGVMDQNTLLTYLSHCSRFTFAPLSAFVKEENVDPTGSNMQLDENVSEISGALVPEPMEFISPLHDDLLDDHVQATNSAGTILHNVVDLWPLIKLGCMDEVVPILRSWKEEVRAFAHSSCHSAGPLTFVLIYLHVIKLLGKVWAFLFRRNLHSQSLGILEAVLCKIEKKLKELLYRHTGLSRKIKIHVLEIMLVTYTMRLSCGRICYFDEYMTKLIGTLNRVEDLSEEGLTELSDFVTALQNIPRELGKSEDESIDKIDLLHESLSVFSLKNFELSGEIKYLSADLHVSGNDFQNPLPFISGLPVGIPFDVKLYNTTSESRLWFALSLGEKSTEFLFLDLLEFEGCDQLRKLSSVATFFGTPKVKYFSLKVSIVMECLSGDDQHVKHYGGPKYEYVHLCKEKDVYLSMGVK